MTSPRIKISGIDLGINLWRGISFVICSLILSVAWLGSQAKTNTACPVIQNTPAFSIVYGYLTLSGLPAPAGTLVLAKSPRGDVVGCFETTQSGLYGAMYLYGEDNAVSPPVPGMRPGEQVWFYVNDYLAAASPALIWNNDKDLHAVDLTSTAVQSPSADFTGSPNTGSAPLLVQFTDLSTGTISTRSWDFGDGSPTSSLVDPAHTYTTPGDYAVKLIVSGPGGSDAETKTDYIHVTPLLPQADFSAAPLSGISPLTVAFTNLSSRATDYAWDFGDGLTSTFAAPSHTYINTSGSSLAYTVTLTASNQYGVDSNTRSAYITVYAPVIADFSASATNGMAPLTVTFTNQTTGDWNTLAWDFGDGSPGSAENNPVHTFTTSSTYTVSLTASGPGGTNAKANPITVLEFYDVYLPLIIR